MKLPLEEALIEVWRQALVENAKAAELGSERYPVRSTPKRRLRQVAPALTTITERSE
jgi:hypothetical protein